MKEDESRYFVEKNEKIYELLNSDLVVTNEGQRLSGKRNEYVGILNYLFSDATTNLNISNRELEPKSLIAVSKKYHENVCPNEVCTIYEMAETKSQISLGLYAGGYSSSFNFGGLLASDVGHGAIFGTRLQIDQAFAWEERVSVSVDLALTTYHSYTFDGTFSVNQINYNETYYEIRKGESPKVDLQGYSLKIPLSINYNLLQQRVKPYVGVGACSNCFSSSKMSVLNISFLLVNLTNQYHFITLDF